VILVIFIFWLSVSSARSQPRFRLADVYLRPLFFGSAFLLRSLFLQIEMSCRIRRLKRNRKWLEQQVKMETMLVTMAASKVVKTRMIHSGAYGFRKNSSGDLRVTSFCLFISSIGTNWLFGVWVYIGAYSKLFDQRWFGYFFVFLSSFRSLPRLELFFTLRLGGERLVHALQADFALHLKASPLAPVLLEVLHPHTWELVDDRQHIFVAENGFKTSGDINCNLLVNSRVGFNLLA